MRIVLLLSNWCQLMLIDKFTIDFQFLPVAGHYGIVFPSFCLLNFPTNRIVITFLFIDKKRRTYINTNLYKINPIERGDCQSYTEHFKLAYVYVLLLATGPSVTSLLVNSTVLLVGPISGLAVKLKSITEMQKLKKKIQAGKVQVKTVHEASSSSGRRLSRF